MTKEEDTITLLFPNSSHVPVSIQDISASSKVDMTDITTSDLSNYIFRNHIQDKTLKKLWTESITPEKPSQLRLIHMGRPLNPQTKLGEIRLELSRVIHISVRPLDAEAIPQKVQKSGGCCIVA